MGFVLKHLKESQVKQFDCPDTDGKQILATLAICTNKAYSTNRESQMGLEAGDVICTHPGKDVFLIRSDGIEDFAIVNARGKVYYEPTLSPLRLTTSDDENRLKNLQWIFCKWPLNENAQDKQHRLIYTMIANAPNQITLDFNEKLHGLTFQFHLSAAGKLEDSVLFAHSLACMGLATLEAQVFNKYIKLWIKYSINNILMLNTEKIDYSEKWDEETFNSTVRDFLWKCGFHCENISIENFSIYNELIDIKQEEEPMIEVGMQQEDVWTCAKCGFEGNSGNFCKSCGEAKEEDSKHEEHEHTTDRTPWNCLDCGTENNRNFCYHCGRHKPIPVTNYKCVKCGWVPDEDETFTPNYCPECGDIIEEEDIYITYI